MGKSIKVGKRGGIERKIQRNVKEDRVVTENRREDAVMTRLGLGLGHCSLNKTLKIAREVPDTVV